MKKWDFLCKTYFKSLSRIQGSSISNCDVFKAYNLRFGRPLCLFSPGTKNLDMPLWKNNICKTLRWEDVEFIRLRVRSSANTVSLWHACPKWKVKEICMAHKHIRLTATVSYKYESCCNSRLWMKYSPFTGAVLAQSTELLMFTFTNKAVHITAAVCNFCCCLWYTIYTTHIIFFIN